MSNCWKSHAAAHLYVNNMVGDVKANPRDFYQCINAKNKGAQGIPPLKLEGLKVLKSSPDLLDNFKIGQGQLRLITETYFGLPYVVCR